MKIKSEAFRKLKNAIGGRLHRFVMCAAFIAAWFFARAYQITKIWSFFSISLWLDKKYKFNIWASNEVITPELMRKIRENMDDLKENT